MLAARTTNNWAEYLFVTTMFLSRPGHPVCTGPDGVDGDGRNVWTSPECNEQDFALSEPVGRVDW